MKLAEIWLRPETALALPSSAVWHLERNNLYEKVLRKMGTDIGHPVVPRSFNTCSQAKPRQGMR